ncbi:MAG: TraR/DksA C4-type zinc finger protein [Patescibacteria group bacterium]
MISEELKKELKTKLEKEKLKLEEELKKFANPTDNPEEFETKYDDFGDDRDDNASEVEEYADNIALENTLETQLREANDALEKMTNGTYGICENCNKEIDIERLKAYPAAKNCIECNK